MASAEHYSRLRRPAPNQPAHREPPPVNMSVFHDLQFMGAPYMEPAFFADPNPEEGRRGRGAPAHTADPRRRSRSRDRDVAANPKGSKSAGPDSARGGAGEVKEGDDRPKESRGSQRDGADRRGPKERGGSAGGQERGSSRRGPRPGRHTGRKATGEGGGGRAKKGSSRRDKENKGGEEEEDREAQRVRRRLRKRLDSLTRQEDMKSNSRKNKDDDNERKRPDRERKRKTSNERKRRAQKDNQRSGQDNQRQNQDRTSRTNKTRNPVNQQNGDVSDTEPDTDQGDPRPQRRGRQRSKTNGPPPPPPARKLGLYKRRIPSLTSLTDLDDSHSVYGGNFSRDTSPGSERGHSRQSSRSRLPDDQRSGVSGVSRQSRRSFSQERKQKGWELPPFKFNTAPLPVVRVDKRGEKVTHDKVKDIRKQVSETLGTYYAALHKSQADTASEGWEASLPGAIPTPQLRRNFSQAYWTYSDPATGTPVGRQKGATRSAGGGRMVAGRHGTWMARTERV